MKSTLILTLLALILFGGSAQAASRNTLDACPDSDSWSLQCVMAPHVYKSAHTVRYDGSTMYVDPELYELLAGACTLGGLGGTAATLIGGSIAASFSGGTAGIILGLACVGAELARMELPPPKPIVVKGPDQKLFLVIDNRGKGQQAKAKPKPAPVQQKPAPVEVPMSKAPAAPAEKPVAKSNEPAAGIEAAPAAAPAEVAPVPKPVPAKPYRAPDRILNGNAKPEIAAAPSE